jgi:2-polyprenyl-6-hydroxyphenyl methylase/3-demethylubiquinone-9 3-methyltransferase
MRQVIAAPDWPESWKLSYHYDRLEVYDADRRSGYAYAYRARKSRTIDMVRHLVPPGARILDVAAAQGNFTLALAELGYRVTWNDLRSELADYVRAKHERGAVEYLPGNVFDLVVDDAFDAVLLTEVIEHVAHPDLFLRKIADLVRRNGWIILTTPNGGYMRNRLPRFSDCENPGQYESRQFRPDADGHIFLLHDDELADLSHRAGLRLHELRHFGNSLTSGHLKLGALLRVIPEPWVAGLEGLTARLPATMVRKLHAGTIAVLQKQDPR